MAMVVPDYPGNQVPGAHSGVKAETATLKALANLNGPGVLIRHDYHWTPRAWGESPSDGQADFVVLLPGWGCVVVEVKSPSRPSHSGDKKGYSSGPKPINEDRKDPYYQAEVNAVNIRGDLGEHLRLTFGDQATESPRVEWMVCFPNMESDDGIADKDLRARTLGKKELAKPEALRSRIESLFGDPDPRFTGELLTQAASALTADFTMNSHEMVSPGTLGLHEAMIDSVADFFSKVSGRERFLHIVGPAGSGKTFFGLKLLERATRLAGKGEIAFLCKTKLLAEWLRSRNPGLRDRIHSIDAFARMHAKNKGAPQLQRKGDQSEEEYFGLRLRNDLRFLDELVARRGQQPWLKCLVIDEAQDLPLAHIQSLVSLVCPDGEMAILSDDHQQIIGGGSGVHPKDFKRHELRVNWRNHQLVSEGLLRFRVRIGRPGGDNQAAWEIPRGMPLGSKPVLELRENLPSMLIWLRDNLTGLLEAGLSRSDIAVLTDTNEMANRIVEECQGKARFNGADIPFALSPTRPETDAIQDWISGKKILVSTVHSFKGVEARKILFLVTKEGDLVHYVGASRGVEEFRSVALSAAAGQLSSILPQETRT